jgi:hypothetical protein
MFSRSPAMPGRRRSGISGESANCASGGEIGGPISPDQQPAEIERNAEYRVY